MGAKGIKSLEEVMESEEGRRRKSDGDERALGGRKGTEGMNLISFWLVVTEQMKLDERGDLRRHRPLAPPLRRTSPASANMNVCWTGNENQRQER